MKASTKKINRWDNLIEKISIDFNDGQLIDLEGIIYLLICSKKRWLFFNLL